MTRDPYKYFRVEARDIVDELTRLLLDLEKGQSDNSAVAKLLRLAHTLKGAAHVVKQTAIAQDAHAIEDILAPHREGPGTFPRELATAALRIVSQIGGRMESLQMPAKSTSADQPRRSPEGLNTVRVEVNDVETLLASLAEVGVQLTTARNEAAQVKRVRHLATSIAQNVSALATATTGTSRSRLLSAFEGLVTTITSAERKLTIGIERAERELADCRETANRLRLLPAETVLPALTRAACEAADALGKQVQVEASGGGIRLDADVLAILQDALLHLIRNAVSHGIEGAAIRTSAHKPAIGKVTIGFERKGSRIICTCQDDGAGLDLAAIRKVAVKKGIVSASDSESLRLRDGIELLLNGGLSTSENVTPTSGRGIGLEIVRDCAERLRGEVAIESNPGLGTAVSILVPVSLTSVNALLVESAGTRVCLPLDNVRQTFRVRDRETTCSGPTESIPFEDRAIPFLPLSEALGRSGQGMNGREHKIAVVLSAAGTSAAIGVEKLIGACSVLMRSLPAIAGAKPLIAGASLDGEGNPLLVLDAASLIALVGEGRASQIHAGERKWPLLIVDDSLTTRMVEQNLLESAGYEVETASSGEEGIRMAHLRKHSLFLVDVEMPEMDGFEFISRAHNDPLLRDVPSILVSSRTAAADKIHGEEVGARAYFAKGEFDQARFLETVAQLVNGS